MLSQILKIFLVLIATVSTFAFPPMSSKPITDFDVYMTFLMLTLFFLSLYVITERDKRR
jgi:hypothetical protein